MSDNNPSPTRYLATLASHCLQRARARLPAPPPHVVKMSVLFVVVLATRVPFLQPGYGGDPDAWSVANTARALANTGTYHPSRLPGYPLQEFLCGLLWWLGCGPWLNAVTAMFSAVAAVATAAMARKLRIQPWLACGAAMAAAPIVYVHSCNLMDYMWALAFLMLALYFAVARRPVAAGLLVGLAMGCRLTSLFMIVPVCMLALRGRTPRQYPKHIARILLPALLTAGICYLPLYARFGTRFLTFYEKGYPPLTTVATEATVGVWGDVGTALLLILLAVISVRGLITPNDHRTASPDPTVARACLVGVCLYGIGFLRLPHEAGYLIPAVPLLLLLLALHARQSVIWALSIVLAFSALTGLQLAHQNSDQPVTIVPGPVIIQNACSAEVIDIADNLIDRALHIEPPALIVCGWYLPVLETRAFAARAAHQLPATLHRIPASRDYLLTRNPTMRNASHGVRIVIANQTSPHGVQLIYWADSNMLRKADTHHVSVYYIPGLEDANENVHGIDLQKRAQPLRVR